MEAKEIAKQVKMSVANVFNRYNAAITLMRELDAPEYSTVGHCEDCGTEIKYGKRGSKKRVCGHCSDIRYKRGIAQKKLELSFMSTQIWPPYIYQTQVALDLDQVWPPFTPMYFHAGLTRFPEEPRLQQ